MSKYKFIIKGIDQSIKYKSTSVSDTVSDAQTVGRTTLNYLIEDNVDGFTRADRIEVISSIN